MTNTVGNRIHPFSLKVLFTNDYDVKKTVVPAEVIKNCVKYIFVG